MDSSIVAILLTLLGGLALFFKTRSDKANRDAILGQTKGQDIEIEKQQKSNEEEIRKADKEISDLLKSKKTNQDQSTDSERADKWNK